MVEMALLLYRGLIVIFLITNTESFSLSIFGEEDKLAEKFDSAGKFKCFSTYELVEVLKYDIHYDEVRFSKNITHN
jgi:hypothetical protein